MPLAITSYTEPEKLFSFDGDWGDKSDVKFASSKEDLDDPSTDTNIFIDPNSA